MVNSFATPGWFVGAMDHDLPKICGILEPHELDALKAAYNASLGAYLKGRSEVRLREGLRAAHSRLEPNRQYDLSPEVEAYFAKKGCEVPLPLTPEAIGTFKVACEKDRAFFHVTCWTGQVP